MINNAQFPFQLLVTCVLFSILLDIVNYLVYIMIFRVGVMPQSGIKCFGVQLFWNTGMVTDLLPIILLVSDIEPFEYSLSSTHWWSHLRIIQFFSAHLSEIADHDKIRFWETFGRPDILVRGTPQAAK